MCDCGERVASNFIFLQKKDENVMEAEADVAGSRKVSKCIVPSDYIGVERMVWKAPCGTCGIIIVPPLARAGDVLTFMYTSAPGDVFAENKQIVRGHLKWPGHGHA